VECLGQRQEFGEEHRLAAGQHHMPTLQSLDLRHDFFHRKVVPFGRP